MSREKWEKWEERSKTAPTTSAGFFIRWEYFLWASRRLELLEKVAQAGEQVTKTRPKIARSLSPYVTFDMALDDLGTALRDLKGA